MPRHHRWFAAVLLLASCVSHFASAQTPPRKIVHVVAERFAFMPSEVVVDEGTLVEIVLRSDDTNHGFRLRGTGVNVIIPKRGRGATSVWFDADAPGRYEFECSKMCGAGHAMMKGAIIVKPRTDRPPSPEPSSSGPSSSEKSFDERES